MTLTECPSYVSNLTSAECVGNVQVNSMEFTACLFFALIFIVYALPFILIELKGGEKINDTTRLARYGLRRKC